MWLWALGRLELPGAERGRKGPPVEILEGPQPVWFWTCVLWSHERINFVVLTLSIWSSVMLHVGFSSKCSRKSSWTRVPRSPLSWGGRGEEASKEGPVGSLVGGAE